MWAVLILFSLGLGPLLTKLRPVGSRSLFWRSFLSLAFLTLFLGLGLRSAERARLTQMYRHEGALKPAGLWLREYSDPGARIQLEPLGYIGYYSERIMIDEVGLVTPQMVELKRRGMFDLDQYLEFFQPDYVLLHCDDSLRIL